MKTTLATLSILAAIVTTATATTEPVIVTLKSGVTMQGPLVGISVNEKLSILASIPPPISLRLRKVIIVPSERVTLFPEPNLIIMLW